MLRPQIFIGIILTAALGSAKPGHGRRIGHDTPCWMGTEDFLTNFTGSQGWEANEPVYAAQTVCNGQDRKCVGVKKFYPYNKTTVLNDWKKEKILYYPFGLVQWINLQDANSRGLPLIIGKDQNNQNMMLCRYSPVPSRYILGTYSRGDVNCTMKQADGALVSRRPFETLVISAQGELAGLDSRVEPCQPRPDECIRPKQDDSEGEVTPATSNGDKKQGKEAAKPGQLEEPSICWKVLEAGAAGEETPFGKKKKFPSYLVRLTFSGKLLFGNFVPYEQNVYGIGCKKPGKDDRIKTDILSFPNGTINWVKTNKNEMQGQLPKLGIAVGSTPGNPYSLDGNLTYFTICQISAPTEETSLLGIANTETGTCDAVFMGQTAQFPNYWIPVKTRGQGITLLDDCKKPVVPEVFIEDEEIPITLGPDQEIKDVTATGPPAIVGGPATTCFKGYTFQSSGDYALFPEYFLQSCKTFAAGEFTCTA